MARGLQERFLRARDGDGVHRGRQAVVQISLGGRRKTVCCNLCIFHLCIRASGLLRSETGSNPESQLHRSMRYITLEDLDPAAYERFISGSRAAQCKESAYKLRVHRAPTEKCAFFSKLVVHVQRPKNKDKIIPYVLQTGGYLHSG